MTFPSYSSGTVTVAANGTTVTGSGTVWSDVNARAGDLLQIGNFQTIISEVTDPTHLVIPTWGGGAQTSAAYVIWHTSPLRFAGGQAMADVSALVAALNTDGFYVFVPSTATDPDPSYGNDGQYAFQASTGKLWLKSGGVWTFLGIYKAFGLAAPWSALTAYEVNDVATLAGSSYVCILAHTNHTPPNATYWAVLAAKGDTGATGSTGAAGAGYGGTSTTSLLIGTGSKAFTTQAGLAYVVGSRVRAASNANGANYMEGLVTAYSGTTLTVNVSRVGGSGTLADWNLSIAGDPGSGDLLSSNNLSDVANPATARTNLGATSTGSSLFTAADATAAREILPNPGALFGLWLSSAGSSATFGISVGFAADSTNVRLMKLASAFTKTTSAWAVGTGNGALDTGAIAANTWYHGFLIKRLDTGNVDPLISLSPTAPTLPANYTLFRRIGSMKTNGSAQWTKFIQNGDEFLWDVPVSDASALAITMSVSAITLTVPTGIIVSAIFQGDFTNTAGVGSPALLYSPATGTQAAGTPAGNWSLNNQVANQFASNFFTMRTNTSAQINAVGSAAANNSLYIITSGWVDRRGRDS